MIELFGDDLEVLQDYLKRDRLIDFIDDSMALDILNVSKTNALNAKEWFENQMFEETSYDEIISKYCKIQDSENLDTNSYSDIRFPSNCINLYNDKLKKLYITLKDDNLSYNRFRDVFLIHEFYHYIEEYELVSLNSFTIKTYGFGRFKLSSKVDSVSEISATFFVRELVGDVTKFLKQEGK